MKIKMQIEVEVNDSSSDLDIAGICIGEIEGILEDIYKIKREDYSVKEVFDAKD